MDLQLKGKRALVSGSSAGIGFAIAKALALEGASVFVNGRSAVRTKVAAKTITDSGATSPVYPFVGDLSHATDIERLSAEVPDLDILVNNLGIYEPKPFEAITDEDWLRFFDVNVLSGIRLSRMYLPGMKTRNWGRIVFISSESGLNIPVEMIHYGMTKTAQLAISRGLAESVAGTGVTVNAVLPGPAPSDGVVEFFGRLAKEQGVSQQEMEQEFIANHRPTSLIRRLASVEEVANMVVYVCSPQASATTGAALRVDGGVVRSIA